MKLNVTPAEMDAIQREHDACQIAPDCYDVQRWTRFMEERFGIRSAFPPVEYRLVVRKDVLAIPCVGVERIER